MKKITILITTFVIAIIMFIAVHRSDAQGKKYTHQECVNCHMMLNKQVVKNFLASKHKDKTCLACHTETHDEATSQEYRKTVWRDKCIKCHKNFTKHIKGMKDCRKCHTITHNFKPKAGTVNPIPADDAVQATPEPTPEATVVPTPEETVEPTPEATVEPTPEETVEPTPEATVEPTPEETVEPTPEVTVEPTPEETVEPTPEVTVEPTPEETSTNSVQDSHEEEAKEESLYLWGIQKGEFYFFHIVIITVLAYLFTYILAKIKILKKATHLKLWNILLCTSFLASCYFAVYLIFLKDLKIIPIDVKSIDTMELYNTLHIQTGVVMMMIGIFHILWHWKYFLHIIIKPRKLSPAEIEKLKSSKN